MKLAPSVRSRRRIPVNASLFIFGLALVLALSFGLEISGVKVPATLQSWWIRGTIIAVGVGVVVLSFRAAEPPSPPGVPPPAPAGPPPVVHDDPTHRPGLPLPALVPGTAFIGHIPAVPPRFVARANVFDAALKDLLSHAAPGSIGLVGMGGAGKTTLATALAHDPAVQAAFTDGIAWVEAGEQNTPTGEAQSCERLLLQKPSAP